MLGGVQSVISVVFIGMDHINSSLSMKFKMKHQGKTKYPSKYSACMIFGKRQRYFTVYSINDCKITSSFKIVFKTSACINSPFCAILHRI
jgi:hypothetical protein